MIKKRKKLFYCSHSDVCQNVNCSHFGFHLNFKYCVSDYCRFANNAFTMCINVLNPKDNKLTDKEFKIKNGYSLIGRKKE